MKVYDIQQTWDLHGLGWSEPFKLYHHWNRLIMKKLSDYEDHIKNEQIKANLTNEQLEELKDLYVERIVDNMETKDLVRYVTDDMTEWVGKLSPLEFFEEAYNYFDDYFDEIVEDVKGGQSVNDLN